MLRGMWGLPRPGIEPMSPALAGRFFTIEPPREGPKHLIFFSNFLNFVCVSLQKYFMDLLQYIYLSLSPIIIIIFNYGSIILGEGNGNPLQYSCLENPWTEEPGRLQSMGSLRVGHD